MTDQGLRHRAVILGGMLAVAVVVSFLGGVSCAAQQSIAPEPQSPVIGASAKCTVFREHGLNFVVRCGDETRLGKRWCILGCNATLEVAYSTEGSQGRGKAGRIVVEGRCRAPLQDGTPCRFSEEDVTRVLEGERKKLQADARITWTNSAGQPDVTIKVADLSYNAQVQPAADDAARVATTVENLDNAVAGKMAAAKAEQTDPDIPDGPVKELGKQEIAILVDALPLSRDAIRFQALDKFILLYAPYTENKALLRRARNAFRNARRSLTAEMASISTSADLNELASIVKRPTPEEEKKGLSHASYAFALVTFTMDGLSLTRAIIGDFYEKVRDAKRLTKEQEERVLGQIGMGPGSSSIYGANFYRFQELKRRIEKDAGIKN